MPYNNYRRYCHRQRMNARADGNGELEGIWRYKQERIESVPLPLDFPFRAQLEAAGYTTRMDLDGAEPEELLRIAGLRAAESAKVLIAYGLLPPLPPPPN